MLRRAFLSLCLLFVLTVQALAVCGVGVNDCYWVGGTASWDGTGLPFASTSGGVGVAANPVIGSNVFFDAASGAVTVTRASGSTTTLGTVNFTGFTGTFAGSQIVAIRTGLTLGSGMTLTYTGTLIFQGAVGGTITSAGKSLSSPVDFQQGSWAIADDLVTSSSWNIDTVGTVFNANGFNVTATEYTSGTAATITMGSGTWTATGTGTVWAMDNAQTVTGSGTLVLNNSSSTARTIDSDGNPNIPVNVSVTAGTGNLTITSGTGITGNLDFTGFTGTWTATGTTLSLGGSLTLGSGMTVAAATGVVTMNATSGTKTITSNSVTFDRPITFDGVGGTWQLGDDFNTTGSSRTTTLTNGALDLNNHNYRTGIFSSTNSNVRSLSLGSGTLELTSTGVIFNMATSTNATVNPGTSTIKFTGSSASNKSFNGGGKTFYNLWIASGSTSASAIGGSNTFNDFRVSTPPRTITFDASFTQTVATWTVAGTAGNLITLNSSSGGTPFTLSDTTGTNTCDYCSITDSTASGGATWCATNSTNGGGNSGWNFACTGGATPSRLMLIGVGGTLEERYRPANDNDVTLRNAA